MQYRIKIDYRTGDSSGSEDVTQYLELQFNNLDVARQNLQRIKEHYQMTLDIDDVKWTGKPKTEKEILSENKHKDWFVDIEDEPHLSRYCIILYTDENNKFQMSCFWVGFFEHLNCAEIELVNEKITF